MLTINTRKTQEISRKLPNNFRVRFVVESKRDLISGAKGVDATMPNKTAYITDKSNEGMSSGLTG